jgi:hypothetical protein
MVSLFRTSQQTMYQEIGEPGFSHLAHFIALVIAHGARIRQGTGIAGCKRSRIRIYLVF